MSQKSCVVALQRSGAAAAAAATASRHEPLL